MKTNVQKIVGWVLLLLCLQWIVPPALWHSCASHVDTVDHEHAHQGLAFDVAHEHCPILDLTFPPFDQPATTVIPEQLFRYVKQEASALSFNIYCFRSECRDRAPPLNVV